MLSRTIPTSASGSSFSHKGIDLEFDVAQTLFSGHEIDQGSALLLRSLDVATPARVLDLGCGYGVLGITLARLFPDSAVDDAGQQPCSPCATHGETAS